MVLALHFFNDEKKREWVRKKERKRERGERGKRNKGRFFGQN